MNQLEMKHRLIRAFKEWIESQGLSQRQAADRLDISWSQMSEILRGNPRYTAGWLLDRWVATIGTADIILGLKEEFQTPPTPDKVSG